MRSWRGWGQRLQSWVADGVSSAGEACNPAPGFHAPILNSGSGWSLENLIFTPTLPTTSGFAFQVRTATTLTVNAGTTGVGFYLSSTNTVPNDWYCEYGSTQIDTGVAEAEQRVEALARDVTKSTELEFAFA